MKGIILAGGKGTRLYPVTKAICKQLLPVYDKPMIYYPLSTLMLSGIQDILIISTSEDMPRFKNLLGDGSWLGIKISYAIQAAPRGIAESFLIAKEFIGRDSVALILGDNILYGHRLIEIFKEAASLKEGGFIFGYYVNDPRQYGVIECNRAGKAITIKEKPKKTKSNWAVIGLYFFDNDVVRIAERVTPSKRKELEITDILTAYLKRKKLQVKLLTRGYAWLDTGTAESLIEASMFIKTIEERQGLKIGCIEEVAYRMGFIDAAQLEKVAKETRAAYGEYLRNLVKSGK